MWPKKKTNRDLCPFSEDDDSSPNWQKELSCRETLTDPEGSKWVPGFWEHCLWVAWTAICQFAFLHQVMSKAIWWWERQRTLWDTGTMSTTGTYISYLHFLVFLHRKKQNYSEFQHQLLHTGKGLQIYLDGYQCFFGSCCFPAETGASSLCQQVSGIPAAAKWRQTGRELISPIVAKCFGAWGKTATFFLIPWVCTLVK